MANGFQHAANALSQVEALLHSQDGRAATGRRLAGRVGPRGSEEHVRSILSRALRDRERESAANVAESGKCQDRSSTQQVETRSHRDKTEALIEAVAQYSVDRVLRDGFPCCDIEGLLAVPFAEAETHADGVSGPILDGQPMPLIRTTGTPLRRVPGGVSWTRIPPSSSRDGSNHTDASATAAAALKLASASTLGASREADAPCDDFTEQELLELLELSA